MKIAVKGYSPMEMQFQVIANDVIHLPGMRVWSGWRFTLGLDTKSVIKWWGFFPDSLVYRSDPFAIDWGVACCTKGKDIVCITCRVIVL